MPQQLCCNNIKPRDCPRKIKQTLNVQMCQQIKFNTVSFYKIKIFKLHGVLSSSRLDLPWHVTYSSQANFGWPILLGKKKAKVTQQKKGEDCQMSKYLGYGQSTYSTPLRPSHVVISNLADYATTVLQFFGIMLYWPFFKVNCMITVCFQPLLSCSF